MRYDQFESRERQEIEAVVRQYTHDDIRKYVESYAGLTVWFMVHQLLDELEARDGS